MIFPSIRIEGAILSPDILDRIENAQGQRPVDFGLESSAKVKDEILRVWADAQHYWNAFQRKLESLKADSPATTETRNLWVVPLLTLLGYQLEYQARGAEVNGKTYPISHRVVNRGNTAFHIIGYLEPSGLDKKPEKIAHRMSAHAMGQEYLNLDDQLYGLVTNGRLLRLLRNSSRLVKLSYLEFDLDRIFADGLFADFAVLFRLLHASRLPQSGAPASSCWLERYHQETIEQGTRIRDGLRDAVTEALEILGTGLLAHPDNAALRQQVKSGELRTDVYFGFLLRVIYRLLFLMVIEERRLVFPVGVDPKKVALYFEHYSVQRLRRLSVTRGLKIERFHDAWLALLSTFQLFESPARAGKFGTTVLGGQLFSPESLGPLVQSRLDNAALFGALDRLCYFYHPETKQRMLVNFGALATEEFGSVYESLLELHAVAEIEPKPHFGFRQVAGNERKTTGSYYTPTSLVTCLLDSALDPVLEDRIQNFKSLGFKTVDEAVLALNVCDPACGSGHFLIAAAQRIARRLAILRAGDEEPSPELLRRTLREVIGHCIHGVDINPMSVELCKVALWLEAVEPGKSLNFLDHHIKCGNSLLGANPEAIREGIPDEAYEPITGDSKEAAKWMRKLNKEAREGQGHFDFTNAKPWERLGNLPAAMAELEALDDETPEALAKKEKLYRQIVEGSGYESARLLHDTWCAAFVWAKQRREYGTELTTEHFRKIEGNPHTVAPALKGRVRALAEQYRFFHWHIEFPAVFRADGEGGFDCVLGNPPWEKIQLEEQDFFAGLDSRIAGAPATNRKRLIASLETEQPELFDLYRRALRETLLQTHFIKNSGCFPLSGQGNIQTHSVFLESGLRLVTRSGRLGLIVPSGLATQESQKDIFSHIIRTGRLLRLFDFENRKGIFQSVHRSFKFCLVTIGPPRTETSVEFAFYLLGVDEASEDERVFTLDYEDLKRVSPNTLSCPTYRNRREALVSRVMHDRAQPILSEVLHSDPWGWRSWQMFNETHESKLLSVATADSTSDSEMPLYEAKLFHQFDHRYATYAAGPKTGSSRHLTSNEKSDASVSVLTRYLIPAFIWDERVVDLDYNYKWLLAFRRIARSTDERTVIVSVIPKCGAGSQTPVLKTRYGPLFAACVLANLNSIAFDFAARLKVGGTDINHFVIHQLPIQPPATFDSVCGWSEIPQPLRNCLLARVLELTYTAWDLEPFACDCGFHGPPFRWDEKRRFQIRCELDAAFFHLYLGSEQEWRRQPESLTKYFPTSRDAVGYIMDTFPIVKRKDEEKFGTYRTKDTILKIYDDLAESQGTGRPYVSPLNPPPGPPTDEHGHFIPMSQWDPNHWPSYIHPPKDTERQPTPVVAQGDRPTALDESRVLRPVTPRRNERYTNCVPKLDLKIAAGGFSDEQLPEFEEWVEVNTSVPLRKGMFVARVVGRSMEPLIHDGSYCLFQFKAPQLKYDMIGLFQLHGAEDPEMGGSFTVKRLKISTSRDSDGELRRQAALLPENPAFDAIPVKSEEVKFVAEFLEVLGPLSPGRTDG